MTDTIKYPCPVCGAPVDSRCRTIRTRRVTDTHRGRWDEVDLAAARAQRLTEAAR
jgi:endogenous inhibitor of DNA gyrase (YacG/DUF329 family)